MVILACIGICALLLGTFLGVIRKDKKMLRATGIPLILISMTLALGKHAQGFHVFIMGGIAILTAWGARHQTKTGRWISLCAAMGLCGAVCCALLLF